MENIQMVDLKSQYLKIKKEVDSSILNVIENTAFIKGPDVQTFQENLAKYLSIKNVIGCANGTDALQVAMMALGLKPGDEVITACFTYVATAEVIALLQLKPILVDVYPDTFDINIEELEKAITPKTKAIVPVHLFGQCANMEAILDIAKKHKLYVIEDTAQAIGADYTFSNGTTKKAGTMGDIGCTSFFPSKNLGCYGDGGALFCDDDTLANKIKMIANHGQSIQYVHDEVGINSRLDTLQAAILNVKLPLLDSYNLARQNAAAYYTKNLSQFKELITPKISSNSTHVFHQYTICCNGVSRNKLREFLKERNIPCMVYYPIPLHHQKAYRQENATDNDFKITINLCENVFSLPIHTELTTEQQDIVINAIKDFLTQK